MKTYYMKVTLLSPVHIGSGEDYEPTNFVIDGQRLYEFDEMDFYRKLPTNLQREFNAVVSQSDSDILMRVHSFVKKHKEYAMDAAKSSVAVSKGIANDYEQKIGKVVQREGSGRGVQRNVFNRFQIERSQRLGNLEKLYIPGSSIKGAISTAYQESIFAKDPQKWENEFKRVNPSMSIFKNFLVSDLQPVESEGEIGYSVNKERFEDDDQGPNNKIEAVLPGSTFVCTLSFKALEPKLESTMEEFAKVCNVHYRSNLESLFDEREYIERYLSADFVKKAKGLELSDGAFLLRVGKHSGARAVTIDGIREIKVKESGGGKNRKPNVWETRSEETTVWLFAEEEHSDSSLLPFGWVLCEPIEKQEYISLMSHREEYLLERSEGVAAQRKAYREAREAKAREEREARERREREEAERLARELAEAERLASLSPVDRLIAEYADNLAILINKMRQGEIEEYEEIKIELAQKIKIELQKDPGSWDKAKKKALVRKEFIESLLT